MFAELLVGWFNSNNLHFSPVIQVWYSAQEKKSFSSCFLVFEAMLVITDIIFCYYTESRVPERGTGIVISSNMNAAQLKYTESCF